MTLFQSAKHLRSFSKFINTHKMKYTPNIEIKNNIANKSAGLGIFATNAIEKNVEILRIPLSLYAPYSAASAISNARSNKDIYDGISQFVSSRSSIKNVTIDEDNRLMQVLCTSLNLVISLLYYKDEYAKLLYSNITNNDFNHPLLFKNQNDIRLKVLERTYAAYKINLQRKLCFDFCNEVLGDGNDMSLSFIQAMSFVSSRALSGEEFPFTLCPVMDFVNHGEDDKVNTIHSFDNKDGSIILRTIKDVAEEEEILISYGRDRDAASFLTLYGFAPHNTIITNANTSTRVRIRVRDNFVTLNISSDMTEAIKKLFVLSGNLIDPIGLLQEELKEREEIEKDIEEEIEKHHDTSNQQSNTNINTSIWIQTARKLREQEKGAIHSLLKKIQSYQ